MLERDLSLRELSQLTGTHIETLRKLARRDAIPGVFRLGGKWLISREAANRLRRIPQSSSETNGRRRKDDSALTGQTDLEARKR